MERQEEEKSSSSLEVTSRPLPLDLTSEVLMRLPAKYLARSRCVSKLWSSLTTPACFNKSFTARSLQSPCLLIFTIQRDNLVGFSLPQQGNSDKSSCSPVDSFVIKFPRKFVFFAINSVHGLYYFQSLSRLVIWNPTMRWFSTLTKPESCAEDTAGFIGYDPIDGTYKALCMPFLNPKTKTENSNEPRVLTLGSAQESWRFIQGSFEHYPYRRGQCINGVLYYETIINSDAAPAQRFLISFHVRSEKFNKIKVPWSRVTYLIAYEGKIASIVSKPKDAVISMWVLEDAERHDWSFRKFSLPFPIMDPILKTLLYLEGVTNAGEFVYAPRTLLSQFHALYFDPKKNSFRRVIYEGVSDDEFRSRHGLENGRLHDLNTFPNHIESLMSMEQ